MEELITKLKLALIDFKTDKKYENIEYRSNVPVQENKIQQVRKLGFNEDLISFYRRTDGFTASWDLDLDQNLLGRMKIMEINPVLKSWEDYFYSEGSDIRIKNFRPVDFFSDEACCGLVLDGSGDQTIYYHDQGDNEIFTLDIDFKSYFELAVDAKIMWGWQRYLVNHINPRNYNISFPEKMKELFPDFDLQAFTAKFESLRLSKSK